MNTPTTEEVRDGYGSAFWYESDADEVKKREGFDRWLAEYEAETEKVALAWERERFDRLWHIEYRCGCSAAFEHLRTRMERSESGIDYDLELGDN